MTEHYITPCMIKLKCTKLWLAFVLVFTLLFNGNAQLSTPAITDTSLQHGYTAVNGVQLHYVKKGNGKKLLMFVHGFPEFWYEYYNQLQYFGSFNDYTVIAPDLRGYNLSSKPTDTAAYQVKNMVEDLRQLATKQGFTKFSLIAHDWGGVIAWWFAIVHPDYLEKLVIINAPHPGIFKRELEENPEQIKASAYMAFFRSPAAGEKLAADNYSLLVNIVLAEGLAKGFFQTADKQQYLQAWAQPGAITGGLNYYRALHQYGYGLDTSSYMVNVPTLVIWGEKDNALLTSNLNGLDKYVPHLTIKRIPDGSHWVIHEQPALINRLIKEFVK